MAGCESVLAAIADAEAGWSCRAVTDDTLLLISPRHYSDGDAVEVLVRTEGDEVVVHDGGEVAARFDGVGLSLDSSRIKDPWTRLLRAHAVDVHQGLVMRRTDATRVGQAVHDVIEALTNLDGLRLLAPSPAVGQVSRSSGLAARGGVPRG